MAKTARAAIVGILIVAFASGALAEEPRGCDKFAWPVDRERAALASQNLQAANAGETRLPAEPAFRLALLPVAEAGLPKPPERTPRQPESFAGYIRFAAPPKRQVYQVTLADAGWIDVIQGDTYVKPARFSGATDCVGVRKVVRFDLEALPFTLQVSGVGARTIGLLVTEAEARQE